MYRAFRVPERLAPAGWTTLVLLAVGLGLTWWGYSGLLQVEDSPEMPGSASLYLVQREDKEDLEPVAVQFVYDLDSGLVRLQVCAYNDVALIFAGNDPPTRAQLKGPSTSELRMVQSETEQREWMWLVLSQDDADIWVIRPENRPPCSILEVAAQDWVSDQKNATVALRTPSLATCRWALGNQDEFDLPGHGVWRARSRGDCYADFTQLALGATWTVSSAGGDPVAEGTPGATASRPSHTYDSDLPIILEDSAKVGTTNSRRTTLGVILGIGLTFTAEALLGLVNALASTEERRRLIRPRQDGT